MSIQTGQSTGNQQEPSGVAGDTQSTDVSLSSALTTGVAGTSTEPQAPAEAGEGGKGDVSAETGLPSKATLAPWGDQLTKEVKSNEKMVEALSKFKTIDELSKSYLELSGKLGNSLQLPSKDASEEEQAAFWSKLGRPETADKYGFKQDSEGSKALATAAFNANLTDKQAQAMFKSIEGIAGNAVGQRTAAMQQQQVETEAALKAEYKGKYPEVVENLRRGLEVFGGDELKNVLLKSGLAYDPVIVKTFSKIGAQLSEAGATSRTHTSKDPIKPLSEGGQFSIKL